jgi:hypothetical protein
MGDQIPPVKDFSRKLGVNSGLLVGGLFFVLGLIMMIL